LFCGPPQHIGVAGLPGVALSLFVSPMLTT
jgi:hypothetical protein